MRVDGFVRGKETRTKGGKKVAIARAKRIVKEAKSNVQARVPKAEAKGECDSYEYTIYTTRAGDHSFLDKRTSIKKQSF